MDGNVGARDCAMRLCFGFACILAALLIGDGPTRWLALLGLAPIASAIFGYCPGYALFGLSTARQAPQYVRVQRRRLAR